MRQNRGLHRSQRRLRGRAHSSPPHPHPLPPATPVCRCRSPTAKGRSGKRGAVERPRRHAQTGTAGPHSPVPHSYLHLASHLRVQVRAGLYSRIETWSGGARGAHCHQRREMQLQLRQVLRRLPTLVRCSMRVQRRHDAPYRLQRQTPCQRPQCCPCRQGRRCRSRCGLERWAWALIASRQALRRLSSQMLMPQQLLAGPHGSPRRHARPRRRWCRGACPLRVCWVAVSGHAQMTMQMPMQVWIVGVGHGQCCCCL